MDLTTNWLGLSLLNPLVPAASPLSRDLDHAKRLEDAGAAALIMYSLFEESLQPAMATGDALPETASVDPESLERYLEQIAALKRGLDIPIVASLNGITASGWLRHAREACEAGADAIELNAYYLPAEVWEEGHYVEQRYLTLLRELEAELEVPINMKLSPWFSSLGHLVKGLEEAGAAGVSLFNRLMQPDIDTRTLRLRTTLSPAGRTDLLLAVRWIGVLRGRVDCSLGATGGVQSSDDVIKLLLVGADVVHLCSVLLEQGEQQVALILEDLRRWMRTHGFDSIDDFRGRLAQAQLEDPAEYERLNYQSLLQNYRQD